MVRSLSIFCLAAALAIPADAQPDEEDGTIDLEAIDALFGDDQVTEPEEDQDETAGDEAVAAIEEEAEAAPAFADEEAAAEDAEPAAEPSDLDRAYAQYDRCVADAAAELAAEGFAAEALGGEAILRCSGHRAAYVNAFYFSLLPSNPGADEPTVRAQAEQYVGRFDAYFRTRSAAAAVRPATRTVQEEVIDE